MQSGHTAAYRRARGGDFEAAAALFNRHHPSNLATGQERDGFISALFSAEQLRDMNDSLCVIVALLGNDIVGSLCCSDRAFPAQPPPYRAMQRQFATWHYRGRPLSEWRAFAYGPVCIDGTARGQGILKGLFAAALPFVRLRFELATAFIARANQRSLAAHTRQLGMEPVGAFTLDGQDYLALAVSVQA